MIAPLLSIIKPHSCLWLCVKWKTTINSKTYSSDLLCIIICNAYKR